MKKIVLFLLGIFLSVATFADAPLVKNIFPQNYGNLTQLNETSNEKICNSCKSIIAATKSDIKNGSDFSHATVFLQKIDSRKFYRIILTQCPLEKLDFPLLQSNTYSDNEFFLLKHQSHGLVQLIVEDNGDHFSVVASDVSGMWVTNNNGTSIYFSDFLIFATEDYTKIIHAKTEVPVAIGSTWDGLTKVTFNPRGTNLFGKQSATLTILEKDEKSLVEISASDFLADPQSPLKYSILSAFDKNPSTVYKENSSENLLTLQFNFKMDRAWTRRMGKIKITQANIINGDSRTRNDYFATDRIGTITAEAWENEFELGTKETSSFSLKDYSLEKQGIYLPFTQGKNCYSFTTTEIIKANKHDLSVGEFNLKISGYGWLF